MSYEVVVKFLCVNEEFELVEKLLKIGEIDRRIKIWFE